MDESTKSLLISLAAEMVRGVDMPHEFDDYQALPKTTPKRTRLAINNMSRMAREKCRNWAIQIRTAVDSERVRKPTTE